MLEDLNSYHVFCQVAQRKSMHAAAEYLDITPVTVTRVIQNLEKNLNCSLLLRTGRGVTLTEEGSRLYERIKFAFDTLSAAEERLSAPPARDAATLSIGIAGYSPHYILLDWCIPKLRERFPFLQVILTHVAKNDIVDAILTENVNFVLGTLINMRNHKISNIPLYNDKVVAAVGRKYAYLADNPADFSVLRDIPFISLPPDRNIALRSALLYQRNGMDFSPAVIVPELMQQIEAVMLGLGYSFFPSTMIYRELKSKELIALNMDADIFGDLIFSLYFASGKTFGAVGEAFLSILEEETSALSEEIHNGI